MCIWISFLFTVRQNPQIRKQHYRKNWENLEQLQEDKVGAENIKKLSEACKEEEAQIDLNIDLETVATNNTEMKNIVTDLLEYEKRKDNTEWFDEECTQLFTQRIKHTRHI
jgi:hypothetical protein